MIGNRKDAIKLVNDPYDPDFTFVDSGSFRDVWRKGDVIYKLETDRYPGWGNEQEYRHAKRYKGKPGIPPVSLYHVNGQPVIAMPYYPHKLKDRRTSLEKARQITRQTPVTDIGPSNIRVDNNGEPWIVDLGAPYAKKNNNDWWFHSW